MSNEGIRSSLDGPKSRAFGDYWIHEDSINVDISTVGQGVYVKITGWSPGASRDVLLVDDSFKVLEPGWYKVTWHISGDSVGVNKEYEFDIFVNGEELDTGSAIRQYGAAGSLGNTAASGIVFIENSDYNIDLRMKESGAGAGSDFDINAAGFNIIQMD